MTKKIANIAQFRQIWSRSYRAKLRDVLRTQMNPGQICFYPKIFDHLHKFECDGRNCRIRCQSDPVKGGVGQANGPNDMSPKYVLFILLH